MTRRSCSGRSRDGGLEDVGLPRLGDLFLGGELVGGEQVAERRVAVVADGLVERRRRLVGGADLLDLLDGQLGGVRDLLVARLVAELEGELALDARDLAGALRHVDGQADGAARVLEAALDRLADPQRAVGREPEALAPVELLDRADQAEHALLHEVAEGQSLPLVLPRDGHDESQVRVDHPLLGHQIAPLDALGELHLLGGSEQGPATGLREQLVQRIDGGVDRLGPVVGEAGLERSGRFDPFFQQASNPSSTVGILPECCCACNSLLSSGGGARQVGQGAPPERQPQKDTCPHKVVRARPHTPGT